MKPPSSPDLETARRDFEDFLVAFTHEIRNRLNAIGLEAADLAEQAGSSVDASRLQQQIHDCSVFLKSVRQDLAPDDPGAEKMALADFVRQLREGKR